MSVVYLHTHIHTHAQTHKEGSIWAEYRYVTICEKTEGCHVHLYKMQDLLCLYVGYSII